MKTNPIFGFIGTGNMGGALATAVAHSVSGEALLLSNRTREKAEALSRKIGGVVVSNIEVAQRADYVFLGVKPQMMAGVMNEIRPTLQNRPTPCILVSMAAGIGIRALKQMAGFDCPVIRVMPNTPAAIGRGVVLCCADGVSPEALECFNTALSGAGMLDYLDEGLIDAGSTVAGCGPAFAAMFMEALADGGVACGLPRAKAQLYAAQMLLGTAELALQSQQHPGPMKDAVCSPGGSTIQGVRALENGGFRGAVMEAVIKAYEKTLNMGKAQ